jgi:hypothetical protein
VTRIVPDLAGIHIKFPAEASEISSKHDSGLWASFSGLKCEDLNLTMTLKIYGTKPPLYKR